MALSDVDIASSLSEPDDSTEGFIFQQTMFRIRDPKASLDFYTRVMGMSNWGSENDPEVKYHNGNSEPKGFGHIGFAVPDVEKACERFEKLGVTFVKKPNDGKMKGIAFVQDPDGYWIEILNGEKLVKITEEFAS